jgi:hypothetical protein
LKRMLHKFYELYPETNYYESVENFPNIS